MGEASKKKPLGFDCARSSPGRWSPKAWGFIVEAVLGGAVLLVMLGLWWALGSSQFDEHARSSSFRHGSRGSLVEFGGEVCDKKLYPPPWLLRSDQLTILVSGFGEARLPLLQASVRTYSSSPAVHSVLVLWGNTSTPASVLKAAKFESSRAPIYIVRQKSTSLNDRFLPRRYIKTKAVMVCDDDITVDSKSLEFALQVWRENQQRIVGFFPRAHSYQLESHSWAYTKNQHKYSIMLTKIMILATDYLYQYSCEMPAGVREYVDKGMNCEDIAMNFLVSSLSGSGPMLVEGQPRDWGDTRNSEEELTSMGLSARADHRKDRGDCIIEFQRLWNGMELQFSYTKAVRDVDEQVNCKKFGQLINCDENANSARDAQRLAGHNLVKRTYQYAYATLIQSKAMYLAALVWAQALRNTGTVHDLVLLLDVKSGLRKDNETLVDHFDVVKEIGQFGKHQNLAKLSAWQLQEYERVVFIDLNLLCLSNVDYLFELPEPVAAPVMYHPDQFHTGLIVLQPSNTTFMELLKWTETVSKADQMVDEHGLLNGFFDGWFLMSAKHRLPMHLNMPEHLIPFLDWSEPKGPTEFPCVLQYSKSKLASMLIRFSHQPLGFLYQEGMRTGWFSIWLKILDTLRNNKYRPLDDEKMSQLSWKPSRGKVLLTWPPKLPMGKILIPSDLPPRVPHRKAFATVVTSLNQVAVAAGWAVTYSKFHVSSTAGHELLLLVHGSVDQDAWQPLEALFDSVVVVDGSSNVSTTSAAILHLWNQTSYEKLVYVDPRSIFLSNCDFLMEFEPFAAASDFVFPDTFSLHVMVIRPDSRRFLELTGENSSFETAGEFLLVRFLNEHHKYWYQSSSRHRIGPIFNDLQRDLEEDPASSWKILSVSTLLDPASGTTRVWWKHVCSMPKENIPLLSTVCNRALA